MKTKKILVLIFTINLFLLNNVLAKDIPIIVISPGKTQQSYDKVGSSVSVIGNGEIKNSSNYFISDVIGNNTTGNNMFHLAIIILIFPISQSPVVQPN